MKRSRCRAKKHCINSPTSSGEDADVGQYLSDESNMDAQVWKGPRAPSSDGRNTKWTSVSEDRSTKQASGSEGRNKKQTSVSEDRSTKRALGSEDRNGNGSQLARTEAQNGP